MTYGRDDEKIEEQKRMRSCAHASSAEDGMTSYKHLPWYASAMVAIPAAEKSRATLFHSTALLQFSIFPLYQGYQTNTQRDTPEMAPAGINLPVRAARAPMESDSVAEVAQASE